MSEKTGLLTFHRTTNFGSVLQTYGLYKKINDLGVPCEIVDYRCPAIERRENLDKSLFSATPKELIRNLLFMPGYKKKAEMLLGFAKSNMILSQPYTPDNITLANDEFDRFIVGSDIVWGRDITDSDYVFFLDFVKGDKGRYAFSSSVGDYTRRGDEGYISKLLQKFSKIAVREKDAIEWLNSLGISDGMWVCDPTMLLSSNEWVSNIHPTKYDDDYVLVYFKDDKGKDLRDAIEYAKANHLKVKMINYDRPYSGVQNVKPYSLDEFLGLIINARMVFTASYHGMLFSIYFHKEFLFYTRAHKSRVLSLAKRLGIEDHCGDDIRVDKYKEVDYQLVEMKVDNFRASSIEILKTMLG